jgi:hypothetical protein
MGSPESIVYIEVNTPGQEVEGQRVYFNRQSAGINGWILYHYDGNTPNIRIVDEDDDPPYIQFATIGGGTFDAPAIVNYFGSRGPAAGATTGFEWRVGGTAIATMDTQFLLKPSGTTAARPTPTVGMTRYNTTFGSHEGYIGGGVWATQTGVIDKSTQAIATTANGNFISYSVPGGTLGTNNLLHIRASGTWATLNATAKTVVITVSYGGTTMWADTSASLAGNSNTGWNIDIVLAANNSATAQTLSGIMQIGGTGASTTGSTGDLSSDEILSQAVLNGTAAFNSAGAGTLNIAVTFSGAGSNNWTKNYHWIEKK